MACRFWMVRGAGTKMLPGASCQRGTLTGTQGARLRGEAVSWFWQLILAGEVSAAGSRQIFSSLARALRQVGSA
jgi:hypothetical protein